MDVSRVVASGSGVSTGAHHWYTYVGSSILRCMMLCDVRLRLGTVLGLYVKTAYVHQSLRSLYLQSPVSGSCENNWPKPSPELLEASAYLVLLNSEFNNYTALKILKFQAWCCSCACI